MKLKVTVHGVAYEVDVEILDAGEGFLPPSALPMPPQAQPYANGQPVAPVPQAVPPPSGPAPSGDANTVQSPIAGSIVELKSAVGDQVEQGQPLLVIEAMKMNSAIAAPRAGKVKAIHVAAGDQVREGQKLVELE